MERKLVWVLFSVMTVVVVVLSAVMIANNAMWKSGEQLLNINKDNVESVTISHHITATDIPQTKEFELSQDETQYLIEEFQLTKFKKTREQSDSGASEVVLKMKDGSTKSFSVCGGIVSINGKLYRCHSYLSKYVAEYGF